jgi:hypothetical protein
MVIPEALWSRRRLLYIYVGIFIIVALTIAHNHPGTAFSLPLLPQSYTSTLHVPHPGAAEDRHLTNEQCLARYPDLYLEADRAKQWYERKGGISKEAVDAAEGEGNARLVILNNKVGTGSS